MSRRKADESSKWRALVPVLGVATQRGIAGNGSSWKVTARENSTVNGLVALHVRCICIPSTTLSCVTPITHCGQNNQRCNCNMPCSKGAVGLSCQTQRRKRKRTDWEHSRYNCPGCCNQNTKFSDLAAEPRRGTSRRRN